MVTKQYAFRFSDAFIAELDAWREAQPVPPSRTDVLRIATQRFIRGSAQLAGSKPVKKKDRREKVSQ